MITLFICLSLTVSQALGLFILIKKSNKWLQYFLIYNGLASLLSATLIFQNMTDSQTRYLIISLALIAATSSGIMLRNLRINA